VATRHTEILCNAPAIPLECVLEPHGKSQSRFNMKDWIRNRHLVTLAKVNTTAMVFIMAIGLNRYAVLGGASR
jgi:hypothetical protein